MSAMSGRWRRIALKLARHASWVLPGAGSPWADAMRRELDYIDDHRAALRWAVGCVLASYTARLTALPRLRWRIVSAPVAAASLLLLIGLVLQGHARDQTAPSRPTVEDPACDLPDASPEIEQRLHRAPIDVNRPGSSPERRYPKPC
jgi:hypothetical protein